MFSQCIGMYIQVQHLHMYVYYTYNTIIRMDVCIYVYNYRCTYVVLLIHNVISINCLLSLYNYFTTTFWSVYTYIAHKIIVIAVCDRSNMNARTPPLPIDHTLKNNGQLKFVSISL